MNAGRAARFERVVNHLVVAPAADQNAQIHIHERIVDDGVSALLVIPARKAASLRQHELMLSSLLRRPGETHMYTACVVNWKALSVGRVSW